ncbi:MAG TPA: hypothetical protein VJ866_13075 [Pyrinomonadaceae bacterium]|nr:hypothetical protein [Pyrinomonadaceae bacterium]
MLTRAKNWLDAQKRLAERKHVIRLDSCAVEPLGEKRGYNAVIEGFNLHPAISPPRVTVGGVLLEEMQFQADGRRIRGVLRQKPRSGRVMVDYGFARATLKGEIRWIEP